MPPLLESLSLLPIPPVTDRNKATRRPAHRAHARVQSLANQLVHASAALSAAEKTLTLARERKACAVGEVLENIQAEQDLTRARLDYLTVVTENNRAQFLLRRAVGESVRTLKAEQ